MNEHLKYIKIDSYKLFQDFEVNNLARVNLIGGKNNVGKSAFMEACYINSGSFSIKEFLFHLFSIKYMRENINILANDIVEDIKSFIELANGLKIESNINSISFKIRESNGVKSYIFDFASKNIEVNVNEFSFDITSKSNNEFIDSFGLPYHEIISSYGYMQRKDEEGYLNRVLNQFDNRIKAFKIIEDKPQCKIGDRYLELSEFGDGIKQIISIVTMLYKCENGYLYIDEIDSGIHYTMFDTLWEIILTLSKRLNVQLFAVTHSKECIESFARVSKNMEDEDIRFIELCRRDNKIKAFVYPYEWFIDEIAQEHEVRGCL